MGDYSKHLVKQKLKDIRIKEGLTKDETILLLCSLYELEDVELLIRRISIKYKEGFNISQISKLKVLTAYLKSILDKIQYF